MAIHNLIHSLPCVVVFVLVVFDEYVSAVDDDNVAAEHEYLLLMCWTLQLLSRRLEFYQRGCVGKVEGEGGGGVSLSLRVEVPLPIFG